MCKVKRNTVHGGDEARYIWGCQVLPAEVQFALELLMFKPGVLDLGQSEGARGRVCTFCVLMHFNLSFCKIVLCFYFSHQQWNVQDGLVGREDQM